jgi:hypothetical protein
MPDLYPSTPVSPCSPARARAHAHARLLGHTGVQAPERLNLFEWYDGHTAPRLLEEFRRHVGEPGTKCGRLREAP